MIGDKKDIEKDEELDKFDETGEFADTMEMEAEEKAASSGNVGEPSVELNVEEIIAELEADMGVEHADDGQNTRQRLEELLEERRASKEIDELEEFAADDA